MRRVILASASRARRDILKKIGMSFTVYRSGAEESSSLKKGCANLVTGNALKKARDAAKHYKSGVVIGADTVVLVGKKIVGKPKSMEEAKKILKNLSAKPQWVYSGIAVIDVDNGRELVDYDKTKVFMLHLTDAEIKRYFKRVSPLDKAGGFDIQGLGGIFIDRIEGCYYNVVGLPLAKLARLLRKTGIDIF